MSDKKIEDIYSPEDLLEHLMNDFNCKCLPFCNAYEYKGFKNIKHRIKYLEKNMPSYPYIREQKINFIFSNRLTTDSEEATNKLNNFLYRVNGSLQTNYNILKSAVDICDTVYGECGLRMYEGNWYLYEPNKYITIIRTINGIQEIVGFIISKKNEDVTDIDLDITTDYDTFTTYLKQKDLMFISKLEFLLIRNDVSKLHGVCRLDNDRLRIDLLCEAYEQLIHDLRYDGPGRLILRVKPNISNYINEFSTSEIFENTPKKQKERNDKAQEEAQRITGLLANSKRDSVILISSAFDKDIIRLPRVIKSTEMLGWLERENSIVAELVGISPSLVEKGNYNANVSLEKVIDHAMLDFIIPLRDNYSLQIAPFLKYHLGIDDSVEIYFDKYKLQQTENENDVRREIALIINTVALSIKNNAGIDSKLTKELNTTISNLNTMLNDSLHGKDDNLKKLL